MTFEEYQIKVKQIISKAEEGKRNLMKEFALSNNPVSIGDVIEGREKTIKVDAIKICLPTLSSTPMCFYSGVWLKKDGTPNVKGETAVVYQNSIRSHIKM